MHNPGHMRPTYLTSMVPLALRQAIHALLCIPYTYLVVVCWCRLLAHGDMLQTRLRALARQLLTAIRVPSFQRCSSVGSQAF